MSKVYLVICNESVSVIIPFGFDCAEKRDFEKLYGDALLKVFHFKSI